MPLEPNLFAFQSLFVTNLILLQFLCKLGLASCSSTIRGVFAGGYDSPVTLNTMDFITIASTGNASDFGDLTYSDPIAHTNGAARGFSGCSDVNGGLGD